jgi:integrase
MAQKRRAEAVWIDSRARWQINVQRDGKRKTFTSTIPGRKGKHEAEGKADDWLEAGQPDDIRFDRAWEIFLTHKKRTTGTMNHRSIESIGKTWFLDASESPNLSAKRLSRIRTRDVQEIITQAGEKGCSKRTCKNILDKLKEFFRFADAQKWEYDLRLDAVTLPTQAKEAERKILQPDQLRTLFTEDTVLIHKKPQPCFYIHAFRFLVLTGYRRGELCGFKREDYTPPVLTVSRAVNDRGEITRGKNKNARRTNVLSARAQQVLADQLDMLDRMGVKSPWLFPAPDGSMLQPKAIYDHWTHVYGKQHGIHVTLHELRHTFVSVAKLEMPEALLKDFVGHSTSMDTHGIYGHELDGDKQRAADILDDLFDRLLDESGTH